VDFSTLALIFAAVTGLMGLALGSFANVLAYRVPAGISLIKPPSSCPNCGHEIRARHNLPVVGWLMLRGRCYDCKSPISPGYPLVEAMTGVVALMLGFWAWQQVAPGGRWPVGFDPLLFVLMIVLTVASALVVTDVTTMRLPDSLTLPLYPVALIGLVVAGLTSGVDFWDAPWVRALLSALVWSLCYGVLFVIGPIFLGKESMGFGDVKLAPVLGLLLGWVGWGASLTGLFAGFLIGAIAGIALRVRRGQPFPFGPFLLAGALLGLLMGQAIGQGYMRLIGL
jgi:leader peptidase (prepilin peptidase)/N-methyltransferase